MHKQQFQLTSTTSRVSVAVFYYKAELFLLLALLLFFAARSSSDIDYVVKSVMLRIIGPIATALDLPFKGARVLYTSIVDLRGTYELNQQLRSENVMLREYLVRLEKDAGENIALKELLNFNKAEYEYISARIFLNSAFSYNSFAIINVGVMDNVHENQVVVAGMGLVGRIYKVFEHNAYVILYNDPNSRIAVYSSDSREKAIMYGDYNNPPYLEYLEKSHNLKSGEMIYTSGDGNVFYPDLPVGIATKSGDQIVVRPFVDLRKLSFVSVITRRKF